jgi:tripartite-type tricarboxylate transporter receptor subunit TctC
MTGKLANRRSRARGNPECSTKSWIPAFAGSLFFVALLWCAAALAQEYPTRTVRLIIPLSAGAGADIAARIVAQRMSEHYKQPVIVENRPGAGGQIGTAAVVKAEPDGHTLLVQSSSHSANPAIYKSLPYDPLRDLVDVALLGKTPYVLVSAGNGPYRTLKALIDAAKAKPGELAYASAGMGTSTHLAAEYLTGLAGIRMIHVPFKGSPEALQDVLGGRSAFYLAPVNVGIGLVKEGKLTPLGMSTSSRAEVMPEVPTLIEQGLSGYDVTLWFGMWAPAGTPPALVKKLNAEVNAIVQEPLVREQFGKLGLQPAPMKPEEFARFVRSEIEMYKRIVVQANIQLQ